MSGEAMLEVPPRLMDGHPEAFAMAYGGTLDARMQWKAGYALVDPADAPECGELRAFGDVEDAELLLWPGSDGTRGFLGRAVGFLDVEPVGREIGSHRLLATAQCPYRFDCEAARAECAYSGRKATERAEVAIILADAGMDARGEERTHERLNAILNDARREYLGMLAEKEREGAA